MVTFGIKSAAKAQSGVLEVKGTSCDDITRNISSLEE
jgi:hypothetical protein